MWKEIVDKIRRYIDAAAKGKDDKLCKPWLTHWDY